VDSTPLYFVHISDTHIGPRPDYELYGCNPLHRARRMIETINALPVVPDFVLHTGDVVSDPDEAAYRLTAEVFTLLRCPVYFVAGNHDAPMMIAKYLKMGSVSNVHETSLSYTFMVKGVRFIVLDGRGPDEIDPHGLLAEPQFAFLLAALERDSAPVAVVVHFPPIPLDSRWLDSEMLLLNGERLHRTLVPIRHRLRGVFFGHVHRGMTVFRDGILYSSVASTTGQFTAWPTTERVQLDLQHPACFNFITFIDDRTIIKEHMVVP